jgi:hypothetical protein
VAREPTCYSGEEQESDGAFVCGLARGEEARALEAGHGKLTLRMEGGVKGMN